MFKNPFSFKGRIRRLEYGLSYILYMVVYYVSIFIMGSLDEIGVFLFLAIFIGLLWFILAQGAKRCHDRGNSGFFQLIPFYGLWMLFGDSDYGPNKYGDNPKGEGNHQEIDDIGKPLELQ